MFKLFLNHKIIFFPVFIICICFLFTSQSFAEDTIKIGVLAPLHTVTGEGQAQAAKLAAEEINEAGGVNGKKLEVIIRDTELDAETGISALKKLVYSDKVVAATGIYSSGVTAAIQPYLSRYKLPFIGTASASPSLTQNVAENYEKFKYYFRLMNHAHRENKFILKFVEDILAEKKGIEKYAIINEQAKWAEDFISWMKSKLEENGLEVVYSSHFDIETKDFAPLFSKINDSGAEFIIHSVAHTPGPSITKAWQESDAPPMGGVNVDAQRSDYWEKTDGACLGEITYILGGYNIPVTDKTKPFWEKYKEKYGVTPDYGAFYTYDSIYLLVDSIKRADSMEGDALVKAIENAKYKGATGLIEWDEKHDPVEGKGRPRLYMLQWQEEGTPEIIYPEYIATSPIDLSLVNK